MLEQIQKYLKKKKIVLDESLLSLFFGIVVVAATAFLAYHYLNPRAQNAKTVLVPSVINSIPVPGVVEPNNTNGQLTPAASTAATVDTHVIQSGDTLWSIAEKYYGTGFDWHQIAAANPQVSPTNLTIGEKLTIPNSNLKAASEVTTEAKITGNSYTVVHGDTLWDIALRAYGDPYRWLDLARTNHLANPSIIHSGNVFTIPR